MIKFFRRIRHNLLSENKTRKYFKYAIGEIVLVVIGILIALQINNWNEQRKVADFELQILYSFKESLGTDLADIDYNINSHNRSLHAANSILNLLKSSTPIQEDSVAGLFSQVMMPTRFVHSTSAFESLKSKGLNIISNNDLQKKIVDVYDSQYSFFLQSEQDYIDQIMVGYRTILPTRFAEGYSYDLSSSDFRGLLTPLDFESLNEDQEFLYYLKTTSNLNMILTEFHYRRLRVNIVELQELIDQEIELKGE